MEFLEFRCTLDPNVLYKRYVKSVNKKASDDFLSAYEVEEIGKYEALIKAKGMIPDFDLFELLKALFQRAYIFGYCDKKEYYEAKNEEK